MAFHMRPRPSYNPQQLLLGCAVEVDDEVPACLGAAGRVGYFGYFASSAPSTTVTILSGCTARAKAARMSSTVSFCTCVVQVSR